MFSRYSINRIWQDPVVLLLVLLAGLLAFELVLGLCVQEDAFISFRYAQNLIKGHGLVFNPGERVEGYTNFLWTLMLAAGMAIGADPVPLSRFMGMISSLLLVLLVFVVARHRDGASRTTGGLLAAALVAASPAVAGEGVQGLETVFFALLVLAAVVTAARGRQLDVAGQTGGTRLLMLSALLFALAALTRPEGVGVFALATAAGWWWRSRQGHAWMARGEMAATMLFLMVYVAYWIWRFDYYGFPFPNTFYAKTGGGWGHVLRGLAYEFRFMRLNPVLTLLTVWALVQAWRHRRTLSRDISGSPLITMCVLVVIGYLGYVVLVGGDFKKTFRFIVPILPLWALLLDAAVSRFGWPGLARGRAGGPRSGHPRRRWAASLAAGVVLSAVVANTLFSVPATLRWSHRRAWDLERRTAAGQYLAEHARPGATLAIHSAGIVPFYSGLVTIDMWGLNDLHIAHKRMPDMGGEWPTGHEKRDVAYVFSRRPTYFVDEWFYVVSDSLGNLRERLTLDLTGLGMYDDYSERSAPLWLDDGRGLNRYWFNFLERVD